MKLIKSVVEFIEWFWEEQDKLCPHCGYYCTQKTIWCIPPKSEW